MEHISLQLRKFRISCVLLFGVFQFSFAQENNNQLSANLFDFWIGEWDLTWVKKDSTIGKGTNRIERILDGKIIQENFNNPATGYKGISISVYNPKTHTWNQSWADNNGGYFSFSGNLENEGPSFRTNVEEIQGYKVIRRMVFKEIQKDRMIWDWEISTDNGETWQLKWRINYQRKG